MIKLINSFFLLFIISSCGMNIVNDVHELDDKKNELLEEKVQIKEINKPINKKKLNSNLVSYLVGLPYFINGVQYSPQENYRYDKIGLASFYGKELHNKKTKNNDLNKVTELLGRHKTLPLPSIVKITNLENGLSLTIKINDRHNDNSSLIEVSRKTAQLLKFYKNKIAKVRIQILSDPSKQMKIVTESMNDQFFNETIDSAPTEIVEISDLSAENNEDKKNEKYELPIEIGFEEVENKDLYLKIFNFTSNMHAKNTIITLNINHKFITEKDKDSFNLIIGPLGNLEANKLVLSFISKGYKKTEFLFK